MEQGIKTTSATNALIKFYAGARDKDEAEKLIEYINLSSIKSPKKK